MDLRTSIEEKLNTARGSYGVFFKDLVTEEEIEVIKGRDDDVFESASLIKLWIMSAVYEKVQEGSIHMDQTIEVREEVFRSMIPR